MTFKMISRMEKKKGRVKLKMVKRKRMVKGKRRKIETIINLGVLTMKCILSSRENRRKEIIRTIMRIKVSKKSIKIERK